jgi:transposase
MSTYQVVCFIQLSEVGVLSVSLKMDKIEYRAVIKFFVKEGLTPNEIRSRFINVYGDSSPSFSTIKKWAAEFKRGRTSLEDDPCEGRPKNGTTPEIIEKAHDMILDDLRMKVREMSETIDISKERVGYILHEELDLKKFCARSYRDKIGTTCTNIMTKFVSEGLRNQSSIFVESFLS